MKMLTATAFVCFLSACATNYEQNGFMGGFDEIQLSEDIFQVSFSGNRYTSEQRAVDFTLLRCAELTLINGYSYFAVIDANSSVQRQVTTVPGSLNVAPSIKTISKPSSSNTVQMFKDEIDGIILYNAEITQKSIKSKYGLE